MLCQRIASALALLQVIFGAREVVDLDVDQQDLSKDDDDSAAPTLHFFVYKATGKTHPGRNSDEALSTNFGNLAGVLSYVHREVIGRNVVEDTQKPKCMRKYDIDRIVRYEVTMKSTEDAVKRDLSGFLGFVTFQNGSCSQANCSQVWWNEYGYVPGCEDANSEDQPYPSAQHYSFPGRCPNKNPVEWCTQETAMMEPGGACSTPEGHWNCTYNYRPKDYIFLDELVGILPEYRSFSDFCQDDGVEFNGPADDDENVTLDFWKDYGNEEKNKERVEALRQLFAKKFPHTQELPDPRCSGPQPSEVVARGEAQQEVQSQEKRKEKASTTDATPATTVTTTSFARRSGAFSALFAMAAALAVLV